jgi:hypothetical protein
MHIIFWLENPKGRDNSEDLGVNERNRVERGGLDASGSVYGPLAEWCKHDNEP